MGKNQVNVKNFTKKYFFIMLAVMVMSAIIIGIILTVRSANTLKAATRENMLSLSNTAASFLDGNEIKNLSADDAPLTEENGERKEPSQLYKDTAALLSRIQTLQENDNIKYIYLVRYEGDRFVFICDPDPEKPAYYGKPVVYTPSQTIAWSGTAAVDTDSYEDEWGKYYTAWSPVKANGEVVAIVGVDFDAVWFSRQVHDNTPVIILCCLFVLAAGVPVTVVFAKTIRKRFLKLNEEMTALSNDLETIFDEIDGIEKSSEQDTLSYDGLDFMAYIGKKTEDMKKRLKDHMEYLHQQANTDYLTKVGNVRAYFEHRDRVKADIKNGTADFAVAMFDINGLKAANDTLGHECGNYLIKSTAEIIRKVFVNDPVYRVGGDEFLVILSNVKDVDIQSMLVLVDKETEELNKKGNSFNATLTLSKGYAVFTPEKDTSYKEVFNRADQHMYQDKEDFYRKNGLKH